MQAVILAGGKSTRTYPLTVTRPKPLLKVANKTLLEWNFNALNGLVEEVILVVGYKKDRIINFVNKIKNKYKFKIKFVEQKEQLGTGHALLLVENLIKNNFISLYGDDIYCKNDVKNILKYKNSILVKKVKNPENFGVIIQNNNILTNIIEKPQLFVSDLVNCGMYVFDKKIFELLKKVKKSKRGEYEIVGAIKFLAMEEDINCVKSSEWFPIGYPWDLLEADRYYRNKKNKIGKNSKINGKMVNSSVGDNCIIDGSIKNSIIMDNVTIEKNSVIEDSVIGNDVYFGGSILSEENVKSMVKGKPVVVKKLGAVLGDNVIANDVIVNPGCKIWPSKEIKGEVKEDVE
ncbi:MAG: NTP transferase domain-containing protein [Nanoarchaeota archaeon]|nr:NTP transferase domain-containing protein [Nanoarchaeota archaeon]